MFKKSNWGKKTKLSIEPSSEFDLFEAYSNKNTECKLLQLNLVGDRNSRYLKIVLITHDIIQANEFVKFFKQFLSPGIVCSRLTDKLIDLTIEKIVDLDKTNKILDEISSFETIEPQEKFEEMKQHLNSWLKSFEKKSNLKPNQIAITIGKEALASAKLPSTLPQEHARDIKLERGGM